MAKMDADDRSPISATKRCWNCSTHLSLDAERCSYCGQKVGVGTEHGIAKKPIDWKAYGLCLLSAAALFAYVWYAFFRK